jgi:hypothetical protein
MAVLYYCNNYILYGSCQHAALLLYLNSGGVVDVLRASFKCQLCDTVAWQLPLDFLQIGAWPASLTDRVKTIVDCELLQQWDSHRLCNATATLSGFLKGVQHAASATSSMLVNVR